MTMETIITAISTVGFPIVMCVMLFIENRKQAEATRTAIENNTLTIQKLVDKLECERIYAENDNKSL